MAETLTGLHLAMEFAPGGELFARLTEEGPFTERQARGVFAQVASAVDYMHDNYFIHRWVIRRSIEKETRVFPPKKAD